MPLHLKQRGSMWYAWGKIRGKRYRISTEIPVGTRAQRELAARRVSEIDLDIRSENHGYTKDVPTFADFWETYQKTHALQKGAGTQVRDEGTMRLHALPFFGEKRLDVIKKSDCLRYLTLRRQGVQAHPGRKTPGTIREGSCKHSWNRLSRTGTLRRIPGEALTVPLTKSEIASLLMTSKRNCSEYSALGSKGSLCFYSGPGFGSTSVGVLTPHGILIWPSVE
jgi:hypothetical protein